MEREREIKIRFQIFQNKNSKFRHAYNPNTIKFQSRDELFQSFPSSMSDFEQTLDSFDSFNDRNAYRVRQKKYQISAEQQNEFELS